MRCPRCGADQAVRASGMSCRVCSYEYLLNPKDFPHVTDRRLERAAARVSDNGRHWYTATQVYGALVRRRYTGPLSSAARPSSISATIDAVGRLGRRWPDRFPKLIHQPTLNCLTPAWPEPDLFDYGAERVLVVDQALIVDLLVRNGVHVDARAIVVAIDGYPGPVVARMRDFVAQRSDIPVHLLHASDVDPTSMAQTAEQLLGRSSTVHDVGLSSAARTTVRSLRWARRLPAIPVDALTRGWLTAGLTEALGLGTRLESLAASRGSGWDVLAVGSDGDYG